MWVQFLGQEDPLNKEMATNSSILAQKIPWTEEPGGPQYTGSQRVDQDWVTEHANDKERICNYEFSKYSKISTLKKGKSEANRPWDHIFRVF